jgi:hypothetical protein
MKFLTLELHDLQIIDGIVLQSLGEFLFEVMVLELFGGRTRTRTLDPLIKSVQQQDNEGIFVPNGTPRGDFLNNTVDNSLAIPRGLEPLTPSLGNSCSIQLSYGTAGAI